MELEERKIKEIEHSDRRRNIVKAYEYLSDASIDRREEAYINDTSEYKKHFSNIKFYSIASSSFSYRDKLLYNEIKNKRVLDYCCGNGEIAVQCAKMGASEAYGIDISSVAISNAKNLSIVNKIEKNCSFSEMDAENMTFEDNYFDCIHEYGALHHVNLRAALKECVRVLKPGGSMICTEALKHNPFIHLYRKRTMHLRTEWEVEHILGVPEIMIGKEYFEQVNIKYFHLLSLAAVPFRHSSLFNPLLKFLNIVDDRILSIPLIQKMAWVAVFEYKFPKKYK